MKKIVSFDKCTGCGACENICPINCISMNVQDDGFFYPVINTEKCIECGACKNTCPVIEVKKSQYINLDNTQCFGSYSLNNEIRIKSSSGGIFSELAIEILNSGGFVVGATLDEDMNVVHTIVDRLSELYKLRGSKYVQSRIGLLYSEVEKKLKNNKQVLFTGTPCQVSGLKKYLKIDYHNLYLVEFICHGVPSSTSWNLFLNELKTKYNSDIKSVKFRDKKYGWKNYRLYIEFKNKNYSAIRSTGSWLNPFEKNIFLRNSCYECKFKYDNSDADIILGDLWGASSIDTEFDSELGSSVVIVRTEKGQELFKKISEKIFSKQIDLNEVIKFNKALIKSETKHKDRNKFVNKQFEIGFSNTVNLFCKDSLKVITKRKLFFLLKLSLEKLYLLNLIKKVKKRKIYAKK